MKRQTTRLDLISGLTSGAWSALINLAVVPLYLRFLGLEAYGLIGFYVALMSILAVLDLGLSATMSREVARGRAECREDEVRSLLRTLELVYWGTAVLIGGGLALSSAVIADHWLRTSSLPRGDLSNAIATMGLVIGLRWPVALYSGALIGASRLSVISLMTIVSSTVASVGAVLVLWRLEATVHAFFVWQAVCAFMTVLVMRWTAWRDIGRTSDQGFDFPGLKRIWRFSGGLSIAGITGAVLMQSDKIALARLVPLSELGIYTLAATVARVLYIALTPVFNIIYPRLTALMIHEGEGAIVEYYSTGTRLLLSALVPVTTLVALMAPELVEVWTGDAAAARALHAVLPLLMFGNLLNGIMHFPYALQLAAGRSRLPAEINLGLLTIFLPMLLILVPSYGIAGAAFSWLGLNVVYLFAGTWLTHRSILTGRGGHWLVHAVAKPAVLGGAVTGLGVFGLTRIDLSPLASLAAATLWTGVAVVICAMLFARSALVLRPVPGD